VMMAYQAPQPQGPQCTVCRNICQVPYFKCNNCQANGKSYFLCGTCHGRLPKKSAGLFGINNIVKGIERDISTVARVLDSDKPHESWHDYSRVDPQVVMQPAYQQPVYAQPGAYVPPPGAPQMGGPQMGAPPQGGYATMPPQGYGPNPGYGNPNAPPMAYGNQGQAMSPQYGAPPQGQSPQYAPQQGGYPQQTMGYGQQPYSTDGAPPPSYPAPSAPMSPVSQQPQQQAYSPPAQAQQVYAPQGAYVPPMAQTLAQPANRIQLNLSCRQLPTAQITGERPNPTILVMSGNRELGRTEPLFAQCDPVFKTPVIISKDEAKISFIVFDTGDRKVGAIKDVAVKDIMASPEWNVRLNDFKTGYRLTSGSVVVNWALVV